MDKLKIRAGIRHSKQCLVNLPDFICSCGCDAALAELEKPEEAEAELRWIKEIVSRRPALDGFKTLVEEIEQLRSQAAALADALEDGSRQIPETKETSALRMRIYKLLASYRSGQPPQNEESKPIIDDLLLQEVYSLREKLKIAVEAIKSYDPNFDAQLFTHRLGAVDYDQLIEELNEDKAHPGPPPRTAGDIESVHAVAAKILSWCHGNTSSTAEIADVIEGYVQKRIAEPLRKVVPLAMFEEFAKELLDMDPGAPWLLNIGLLSKQVAARHDWEVE